jgi:hypothetical protein
MGTPIPYWYANEAPLFGKLIVIIVTGRDVDVGITAWQ